MTFSGTILPHTANDDFTTQAGRFLLTWTPRVLVAAFAGYYSLGVAYDMGIMASIDSIAIPILRDSVGYAGLGAAMPSFQWYSAWAVRTVAAAGAGLVYDLVERLVVYVYHVVQDRFFPPTSTSSSSTRPLSTLVRV